MEGPYRWVRISCFRMANIPGMKSKTLATIALVCFLHDPASAQSDNQLWVDGIIGRNFGGTYMFETEFSYQTLLSAQDHWYSLNATPSLEASISPHMDLVSALPLSYTIQNDTSNTSEVRGMLGARYYFTPFKRVQTRLLARWEERFVRDEESREVDRSDRLRVRAEVALPLDNVNWYTDTMWYALADVETFFTATDDAPERFANRLRTRIGVGRKFSYNLRLEFIYTLQRSRNAIADTDPTTDNIFRLRVKYYFTPRVRKLLLEGGGTGN